MRFTTRVPKFAHTTLTVVLFAFASTASSATTFKIIQTFECTASTGCGPTGALTFDQSGNLYGSAQGGGIYNYGAVFEMSPNPDGTWGQTLLYSFDFHKNGESPRFGVAFDGAGNLFGTTFPYGGPQDLGTVFELTPAGGAWTFALLNNYAADGALLTDRSGNVYGPIGPGSHNGGAVVELSPNAGGWTFTELYNFCAQPNCTDGSFPAGPFVFDSRGNLYSTTLYGGNKLPYCADPQGCGVAFELTPNRDGTWTYHFIHAFAAFANDAQSALGALLVDRNGSLYGTAPFGGPYDNGMVFKFTPSSVGTGWKESAIYTFPDCSQGCSPYYGVAMDKAVNLYGVIGGGAPACGGSECGIVYELSPQQNGKWKYTKLHEFSGTDGEFPNPLTVGPDGNIYGTTEHGGQYNLGVAFEITP